MFSHRPPPSLRRARYQQGQQKKRGEAKKGKRHPKRRQHQCQGRHAQAVLFFLVISCARALHHPTKEVSFCFDLTKKKGGGWRNQTREGRPTETRRRATLRRDDRQQITRHETTSGTHHRHDTIHFFNFLHAVVSHPHTMPAAKMSDTTLIPASLRCATASSTHMQAHPDTRSPVPVCRQWDGLRYIPSRVNALMVQLPHYENTPRIASTSCVDARLDLQCCVMSFPLTLFRLRPSS